MSKPSREEVEALIARAWAEEDGALATALTSLLALAYDADTGEKYIERAAISEELRKEALARLAQVEKALEQWKCPRCFGHGDIFVGWKNGEKQHVTCDKCNGSKLNPIARAALQPKGE